MSWCFATVAFLPESVLVKPERSLVKEGGPFEVCSLSQAGRWFEAGQPGRDGKVFLALVCMFPGAQWEDKGDLCSWGFPGLPELTSVIRVSAKWGTGLLVLSGVVQQTKNSLSPEGDSIKMRPCVHKVLLFAYKLPNPVLMDTSCIYGNLSMTSHSKCTGIKIWPIQSHTLKREAKAKNRFRVLNFPNL